MRAYFINCYDSTERFEFMTNHLLELGMQPNCCPAVLGADLKFKPTYGRNGYACLLSHLKWQSQLAKLSLLNNEPNDGERDWALILEDDVVLLGMPDLQPLVLSAPLDATLLQLTTLTASQYRGDKPLWTRSYNGYYGTQMYLVDLRSVLPLFKKYKIDENIDKYLSQPLPPVPQGIQVADSYVYCLHNSYLCRYPFGYSDIKLGSLLHPEHLPMHEVGWQSVRQHSAQYPNPYLVCRDQ